MAQLEQGRNDYPGISLIGTVSHAAWGRDGTGAQRNTASTAKAPISLARKSGRNIADASNDARRLQAIGG
jgi:hypothetical protein